MSANVLLAGGVVSMTAAAADRLLKAGDGDAALLYLHLLRRGGEFSPDGARHALGWTGDRLSTALRALDGLGLVDKSAEIAPSSTPPEPDGPPDYSAADIAKELEGDGSFRHLVSEVERRLGKLLSSADLKILYSLCDYLALPAEVVLMLTTWCIEDTEGKYGVGRKPRLSQIRKEAFVWHRMGVDTAEAADAHIRTLSALHDRERTIAPLLGIAGRLLVAEERKCISAWVNMGFDDDSIRLAYEKTVFKKQSMNWAYMSSILRNWHQKNLHTVAQVKAGDSAYRRTATTSPPNQAVSQARLRDDMDWMDRFLAETDKKEGT